MVKVGEIFWSAKVKGVGDAQSDADSLQGSMDGVAESAIGAAAAESTMADSASEQAQATSEAEQESSKLNTVTDLLSGALFFAADMAGLAGTAMTLYSGATTLAAGASTAATVAAGYLTTALYGVAGAASTAWAAIAGPVGLAIGLFLAVAAVGLLASELLGLTNMTSEVQESNNAMVRSFADMAFLVAGPLAGLLLGAFHLITGDWERAKQVWINTSVEWVKAAARFAARVQAGLAAFGIAVVTGIKATVEAIDFAWRAGWNGILGFTRSIVNQLSRMIVDTLNSAIQNAIGPLNRLIRKANELPQTNISTIDFGGGISAPQVAEGAGQVQNESLESRMARVRNQGQAQLRQVQRTTRERLDRFRPGTIRGDRATRGAPDVGTNINEQRVVVNVEGANAEPPTSRSGRREWASMIGEEVGSNVGNQAGGG
jgi:hypothetical protein